MQEPQRQRAAHAGRLHLAMSFRLTFRSRIMAKMNSVQTTTRLSA
jgi:hypothetical protein